MRIFELAMRALNIFLRIAKFLGKASLGLLLVLVIAVAVIHLPPIQEKITRTVTNYLSSEIEAKVDIQRIEFSILGDVTIHNIIVWDPSDHKILSARQIEVKSNIIDLIMGNFTFDDVLISGAEVELIQREEGSSIQFILDAFLSVETEPTKSSTVKLQFKRVQLENIAFKFTSIPNGTTVDVKLIKFTCQEGEFHTNPNKITARDIFLQQAAVNVLTAEHQDSTYAIVTSTNDQPFMFDAGIGIAFDIMNIKVEDSDFSFHNNQVTNTPKFDPSHVSLKDIQINLSNVLVNKDTLNADLHSLAAQLPGFTLSDASGDIQWNRHQLEVAGLRLASITNQLDANLSAQYDLNADHVADHTQLEIDVVSQISPKELSYFFSDSLIHHFIHWKSAEVKLKGKYNLGEGVIKTFTLKTSNSQFDAEGKVSDILDLEKISWKEMNLSATLGSDFKETLVPFLANTSLPQELSLQVKSSGNPKEIMIDGNILTNWGDAKATGQVNRKADQVEIDVSLTGDKFDLGKWTNVTMLGLIDFGVIAKGNVGRDQAVQINGLIKNVEIKDQAVHNITIASRTKTTNSSIAISIDDPNYRSTINSDISFAEPLNFTSDLKLDHFKVGRFLQMDSSLSISGAFTSKIIMDQSSLEGYVKGDSVLFQNQSLTYLLDTMALGAQISPTASDFNYYSDHERGTLVSNFDFIRDSPKVLTSWFGNVLKAPVVNVNDMRNRTLNFNIALENASLLQLLGIDVNEISTIRLSGEFDEQKRKSVLQATSGKFNGYGISLDSLNTNLMALEDSVRAQLSVQNLRYGRVKIGDVNADLLTKGDTALSNLAVTNDSITLVGLQTRILPVDSGTLVYFDKLLAFDKDYFVDPKNPIYLDDKNIRLNHYQISRNDTELNLNGDLNAFDVSLRNIDLTALNFLLSPDTIIISKGNLTGNASYSKGEQFNLTANVDSLSLYHSNPLTITATAVSDGNQVPFEFLLTNESNSIDLKGRYDLDNTEVDALLKLDINNLELFAFPISSVVDEMNGTLKGETTIKGPLQGPDLKGYLQFLNVKLTTANPKLTFNVADDRILLDNSGLRFNNFTLIDQDRNPLTVNGSIVTKDYQSFSYDLQLNAKDYELINKPDSASGQFRGQLVIDSNIKLKGNEKDTNVEAKITVKDATKLTLVTSQDDVELLKAEGIVEFVDPAHLLDSTALELSGNFYDSLIASLPDFNLNSTVTIQDNAALRIIIDEQSGDYIESSGGASLEMNYNRTGILHLLGNYTVNEGVYRLSFYDLVKKNFTLVKGSTINWNGTPEDGDLNIKAVHTVESNSIGLIGHEIGENEKSIYKRSLDYEIGINIKGTIEKPIISFSLDLPQKEKVSYPVLANKLDRLRQPEYESELNKQVFGLLVLGGFLPESTGSDINSSLIATTALSNSVNNLLASQLNRFASQYIKGVNIDVGIQSYSDYSAPGGKTQTAMDFRVSKSLMNDRLSFEVGGDFNLNQDQSGSNTGKNYRGDVAIIYDLTGNADKQIKLFNNQTYDIIYQEIRNTGISLVFIREFASKEDRKNKRK